MNTTFMSVLLAPKSHLATQRGPAGFHTCNHLCHSWRTLSLGESTSLLGTLFFVPKGDIPSSIKVTCGKCHPKKWPGKERQVQASLVAQWLRIHLSMQGTRVWALVREDPTCCGTTKPVYHNYWAWVPPLLMPVRLEPKLCNKRNHRNKPAHPNEE